MGLEELISEFIDAMAATGCGPDRRSDIVADDKWHRIKTGGEKTANCRYQLKIDGGFAVGRWIHFREGKAHKWNSKSDKTWTPEEKAAWKKQLEADRKQKEKEQEKEYAKAAAECSRIWDAAATGSSHEYADRKKVDLEFARVGDVVLPSGKLHKGILIIPVRKEGKITSLQLIWPNGFKCFYEGGDIGGGFCALTTKDEDKSVIIIVEGWATGKSVRRAMGLPVVVAFNAGNLEPVAILLRKRYPDARIIIAADHDQWTVKNTFRPKDVDPKTIPANDARWTHWREQGKLQNTGMESAQQVGVKIGAHVIFPDFAADDGAKRTDFNDLDVSEGVEAVNARIMVAMPGGKIEEPEEAEIVHNDDYSSELQPGGGETPPEWHNVPVEAYENDQELQSLYEKKKVRNLEWMKELAYNDKGGVKGNSLNNARLYVQNHPDYEGMFCYDEFAQEKVITRCPPWEEERKFLPRTLRDEDVTHLAMHIERHGISLNLPNLKQVLNAVIQEEKRNPAKEYFSRLIWDQTPRLNTWLRSYLGVKTDSPEYVAAVGRKWLAAAVARVFDPGCKFDHILILEGPQNLGKSMALREMATFKGRAYFDDTIKARDLASDKVVPKLQGVLIIELAEMTGFKKMSVDEAKQVISTQYDRIVKKYHNEPSMLPRQFVFAGTMNPLDGYLDDPTGGRRYWPVRCSKINIEALKKDKEQLWAEAVHLYKQGEELWLKDDLYRLAEDAQKERSMIHPWTYELEPLTRNVEKVTLEECWQQLRIDDRTKRNRDSQETISKIMISLGFEYVRRRVKDLSADDNRVLAYWRVEKPIEEPDILEEQEIPFSPPKKD